MVAFCQHLGIDQNALCSKWNSAWARPGSWSSPMATPKPIRVAQLPIGPPTSNSEARKRHFGRAPGANKTWGHFVSTLCEDIFEELKAEFEPLTKLTRRSRRMMQRSRLRKKKDGRGHRHLDEGTMWSARSWRTLMRAEGEVFDKEFYVQFGKCFELGIHEDSTNRVKIAEHLRYHTPEVVIVRWCA